MWACECGSENWPSMLWPWVSPKTTQKPASSKVGPEVEKGHFGKIEEIKAMRGLELKIKMLP